MLGNDDTLPRPRRGVELDQAIVVRLIAIERVFHVLAYLIVAAVTVVLWADYGAVHRWAAGLVRDLSPAGHPLLSRTSPGSRTSRSEPSKSCSSRHRTCGARRDRGGRSVVGAAMGGVPDRSGHGDVHPYRGLRDLPTCYLVAGRALVINVAVVVYLVVAKRLFGLRGGRMALEEAGTDWGHVIEHPVETHLA